jgi:hypothetical protein
MIIHDENGELNGVLKMGGLGDENNTVLSKEDLVKCIGVAKVRDLEMRKMI